MADADEEPAAPSTTPTSPGTAWSGSPRSGCTACARGCWRPGSRRPRSATSPTRAPTRCSTARPRSRRLPRRPRPSSGSPAANPSPRHGSCSPRPAAPTPARRCGGCGASRRCRWSGPAAEPALREVLDDAELGGLARVWLTEHGAADVPAPSEDLVFWLTIDTIAAQLAAEGNSDELRALVEGLAAAAQRVLRGGLAGRPPGHRGRAGGDGAAAPGQEGREGSAEGGVQGAVAAGGLSPGTVAWVRRRRGGGTVVRGVSPGEVASGVVQPVFRHGRDGCADTRSATLHGIPTVTGDTMSLTRRDFARKSAITGAGVALAGSVGALATAPNALAATDDRERRGPGRRTPRHGVGYGPLVPDPDGHPRAARRLQVPRHHLQRQDQAGVGRVHPLQPRRHRHLRRPARHHPARQQPRARRPRAPTGRTRCRSPRASSTTPPRPAAARSSRCARRTRSPNGSASPAPPPTARAAAPLGAPGSPARRPRTRPAPTA